MVGGSAAGSGRRGDQQRDQEDRAEPGDCPTATVMWGVAAEAVTAAQEGPLP
jgi:hypothetical protein